MILKAFTIVNYGDEATKQACLSARLSDLVGDRPVGDPSGGRWAVVGFSKPDYFGESIVFDSSDGTRVLNVEIRERLLPSKVIKTKLQEKVQEMVNRAGRRLNRKEIAQLKDDVVTELLPTAFIKASHVLVFITSKHLIVGSTSTRTVDVILALLHSTFRETVVSFLRLDRDPVPWMTDQVLEPAQDDGFDIGNSAVLKKGDSVVRLKDISLAVKPVEEYLTDGFRVHEVALVWDQDIEFTLNSKMHIRKFKVGGITAAERGRVEDGSLVAAFDADVAIEVGTLKRMLRDLLTAIPEPTEIKKATEEEEL